MRRVHPFLFILTVLASMAAESGTSWAGLTCTPDPQWTWDGDLLSPDHPHPCMTPLVVQLTDDNRDGSIDGNDMPDVVFVHRASTADDDGRLTAVDGLSGSIHFTAIGGPGLTPSGLAAADIDGDLLVELIGIEDTGSRLIAFENDGTFKWASDVAGFTDLEAIGIADLDQDGVPEIFVGATVFDANGKLLWEGSAGSGRQVYGRISHAVDLAPGSPGLELLAGNTLYSASGTILWRNTFIRDGWTAVGDFDGDGDPEIAHVYIGAVSLLDHEGNKLTPDYYFGATPASQPAVADLDGDGKAELFVMQAEEVRALKFVDGDWSLLWSQTTDDASRADGGAAFDFDGDGAFEIVYHDMVSWYIFDGATGDILYQDSFPSATGIETPVVADIDNDCMTEILVTGCSGAFPDYPNEVRAYECAPAARARPIWNQYAYHVDNILDDGTVPVPEQPSWLNHNTWMGQVSTSVEAIPTAVADSPLEACEGQPVLLDGSGSTGCTGGYEYRFSEGSNPICDWSSSAVCEVIPTVPSSVYTLRVRCAGESCEGTAEFLVETHSIPVADAGPEQLLCKGQSTQIGGSPTASGGSGGFVYSWASSPPGAIASGEESLPNPNTVPLDAPTTFTVTVTDAKGCARTSTVFVDVLGVPTAMANSPLDGCGGQPVLLDGSGSTGCSAGYEYRFSEGSNPVCDWSSSAVCEVIPAASSTIYRLHVRCAGETCEETADILVETHSNPVADAGPEQLLCKGQSTQIGGSPTASGGSGGFVYSWASSPPGAIASGEEALPNPNTVALDAPTSFILNVIDAKGCTDTSTVLVDVYEADLPQALGNTLLAVKDGNGEDVLLRWSTNDPAAMTFRIHRGWPKAPFYGKHGADAAIQQFTDRDVVTDGLSHAYKVSGVNCSGLEGP